MFSELFALFIISIVWALFAISWILVSNSFGSPRDKLVLVFQFIISLIITWYIYGSMVAARGYGI